VRDSLYVRDVNFDIQGTSTDNDNRMFMTYAGSVVNMTGRFSFNNGKGRDEANGNQGVMILGDGAQLVNHQFLEYPDLIIRGNASLAEDIIQTNFMSDITIDVSILNALGQELKSFTLSAECAKSWKPYSSGIYLVSIKGSSFSKTEKVLVK
jgi:hypothetical protein